MKSVPIYCLPTRVPVALGSLLLAAAGIFAGPSTLFAVDTDGDGLDDAVETNTGA